MKKTKLLLLSLLTLVSSSMWGQSWADVTDTYLDNADFTADDAISVNLCGYSADASKEDNKYNGENALYWAQDVTDWTVPYTKADGNAGAIFAYGSDQQMKGNQKTAPATNPEGGNSGKALGIFAVWTGAVQYIQDITLQAGHYKFQYTYYNQSGTGTITNYCGFIPKSGTASYASNTTFSTGEWKTVEFEFTLSAETEGQISLGYKAPNSGSGACPMLFIDNVKLFFDNTVDKTNLNALITEAEGLYSVSGVGAATFKTAIDAAKEVSEKATATIAEVLNAETALQAAIDNFKWANASSENPVDITSKIVNADCSSTEGWSPVTCNPNSGQHWDGTTTNKYLEPCNWNANSWTGSALQTISVPNGHYKLVAAGRASEGVTLKLVANSQEVTFETLGDVGGTIATDGTEWSSVAEGISAGKSFANNNGRGWTYKSIDDIIIIDKDLQLGAKSSSSTSHSWCSIDDFKLFYTGPITEADKITAAKADLLTAIEAKPAISANVGDGAFQYSTANADSYNKILTDAQDVYDNPSATLADVNNAKESVTNATLPTLNGPKENTRYALVLKYAGWTYDNKAVTYIANDRNDHGLYNIKYLKEVNSNYAQAFIFTPVEGDKYKLSQIDADGEERFVCTGVPYGGNTAQIRTTTDASKALVVEVRATNTEDKWNLWNTEAKQFIGSQDAGVFTVNSHIDFEIVEAQPAQATLNINEGVKYGTFIAPFKAEIPEGVTLYNVNEVNDEVNGTSLVLTLAEGGIVANTPYVAYSKNAVSETLSGWGTAKAESYTAGALIGTFVETEIGTETNGKKNYVLQNHEGTVGFYKVTDSSNKTIKANRCYMSTNVTPAADVKGFVLDDIVTGISQILSNSNKAAEGIYDLNGNRLAAPQKGINIINGVKVLVK